MIDSTEASETVVADTSYRERYPWHAKTWVALARDPGRLPHALLLHGLAGLGKRAFARRLAEWLLCFAPDAEGACGRCSSCQRSAAGAHPDLLWVTPPEDSRVIGIDQVRGLRDFVALRPHTATRKVVVLEPADAMNISSANALLKVLEEPPESSSLLLVAPALARLPATIRSRCALVPFRPPVANEALGWLRQQGVDEDAQALLEMAGGAPLRALAFARSARLEDRRQLLDDVQRLQAGAEDPQRCAARWKNLGAEYCLEWFQRHVAQAIQAQALKMKAGAPSTENVSQMRDLFRYFDVLSETRAIADGPLDQTLLLEDILIRWSRLFRAMV